MTANPKLDLALRKNRGEKMRRDWVARLKQASACNISPEHFLPLEQTESLKKVFFEKTMAKDVMRQHFASGSLDKLADALMNLSISARLMPVILFSSVDQYLGAVQLPASVALSNFLAIWKVVEEDFCISTLDSKNGLCLERNFYDEGGNHVKDGVYELIAWGLFGNVAQECD
jgi:hypothetical protein